MPFISRKVQSELIDFQGTRTLVFDQEKTKELELNRGELSISLEEIKRLREKFHSNEKLSKMLEQTDDYWQKINQEINSVEFFYEIVWKRMQIEVLFLINYFTHELVNPEVFAQIIINGATYESWFVNNFKNVFLNKLKDFYMKVVKNYANKVSIDIYETDAEMKVKEVMDNIEEIYVVKLMITYNMNETMLSTIMKKFFLRS